MSSQFVKGGPGSYMLSWLQGVPWFLDQYVSFGLRSIISALCLFARNKDNSKIKIHIEYSIIDKLKIR